ncbi:hypothetical protein LJR045_000959 [Microbacterium sp. LjRoot45]|uniref:hypothetical protein n=1 Tax=Microbacterium sp. LjRoot45 TaxID=3342329 RepID=UPI003ECD80B5
MIGIQIDGLKVRESEHVPRRSVTVFTGDGTVVMHPLMRIELEHLHDLTSWSAAALEWINRRIDRQAAAAIARIDRMHRDRGGDQHDARRVEMLVDGEWIDISRPVAVSFEGVADEGNYRWPAVAEEAR